MRRTVMLYIPQPGQVCLGELKIPSLNVETEIGNIAPYVKGREGIETLLRYPEILRERQPIECNGFKSADIKLRALSLQEDVSSNPLYKGYSDPFNALVSKHPLLVSYPSDAVWLGYEEAVKAWTSSLARVVPNIGMTIDQSKMPEIIDNIVKLIIANRKNYGFWRSILDVKIGNSPGKDDGYKLVQLLIQWSIQNAVDAKAKWLAGLTPIIDIATPGSSLLSHRFNEAYAAIIQDRLNQNMPTPAFLYTINLNSTLFTEETWNSMLRNVVANARLMLESSEYEKGVEGVYVSIRNLDLISISSGRVNTLRKLMKELNDLCSEYRVPIWYSRLGAVSFAALDDGASVVSFMANTNTGDVFSKGGGGKKDDRFGKIFNPITRSRWKITEVRAALEGPDKGLPKLDRFWFKNCPSKDELASEKKYRIRFSCPYTIAAMNIQLEQWRGNISQGETNPGSNYLEGGEGLYQSWNSRS